ncbi:hypothetical protein PV328_005090 [Microctonus aethiopoides]|uniref:CHK kinase-like domain-containing protein n=1 Tax=Microctonus aethiopoides TaxID=144406 RepID=A0AA39FL84_9HYME|nr:hypothetical protein PV328_005090 [Microctonus aethiopoides]
METPSWLDKEFVERALRYSENDDTIRVNEILTKPATNKGDNYTSEMIRVSVNFHRNMNNKIIKENRSIIVKLGLTADGVHKDLIEQAGLFDTEINFMTTTLKDMNSILKDTKLGGNCLFTQRKDPSVLVIEDLAPLGFRMADRQTGLDLEHCILAMKGLAKFHASSVAVCEKTPHYKDMYNKGIFNNDNPPEMTKFFTSGMKSLAKAVATWPELGESYSKKLMNISEIAYEKASDCRKRNDNEFNVINHGDFWVNNMLFKYDNKGKVIDHIFVDFQLCVYGSPAIDINYFLNTSPSESVLINQKDKIIDIYLSELTTTMKKLGCKSHPPTLTDLKKSMRQTELYGFLSACTVLPLVLVDKNDAQNLEEIMGQDDSAFNNKAYDGEAYKLTMTRRLPQWNAMGLLDL